MDGWIYLVGVGFVLGNLGSVGTVAKASILTTYGTTMLETTSPILTVSAGLGADIFSRISFWFISCNLANMRLATKSSQTN